MRVKVWRGKLSAERHFDSVTQIQHIMDVKTVPCIKNIYIFIVYVIK
jgi:hypothetical protein